MDTVSFLWTFITEIFITLMDKHPLQCMISFQDYTALIMFKPLHKCKQVPETSHLTTDTGKPAYACQHRIIGNAVYRNSDNYPKTITPKNRVKKQFTQIAWIPHETESKENHFYLLMRVFKNVLKVLLWGHVSKHSSKLYASLSQCSFHCVGAINPITMTFPHQIMM